MRLGRMLANYAARKSGAATASVLDKDTCTLS